MRPQATYGLLIRERLLSLATLHHVKVQVVRRVGQFVPAGTPLLMVNKAERLSEEAAAAFCAAFDFGPSRTLQQDVEFGILQIVDIALKAISPAVNDPDDRHWMRRPAEPNPDPRCIKGNAGSVPL